MLYLIEWFRILIIDHRSLEYIIVFVGTAVTGEAALFVFGFLLAQGVFPLFPAVLFGFMGAMLSNSFWFLLGKITTLETIAKYRRINGTFVIITEAVRRISRGSHLVAIILIKFIIGTSVLTIMYSHKTGLRFKKFIYYQAIAITLSFLFLIPIGYLSERGFSYLSATFQNVYASIGFLLLVILIIVVFQIWLERKFVNMEK